MQKIHHTPDRDRLSVLTAIILLAFALARTVQLPTRPVRAMLFGSSIGFDLNGPFVLLVLVAALISAGADSLMRSHPDLRGASLGRSMIHWILPGGAALGLGLLLNRLPAGVGASARARRARWRCGHHPSAPRSTCPLTTS